MSSVLFVCDMSGGKSRMAAANGADLQQLSSSTTLNVAKRAGTDSR
jgi:hypothetical protein